MENRTNEELVALIYADKDVDQAFMQLVKNLRPIMIKIGRKHLSKLYIYETDDYIQLGTDLLSEDHKEIVPFRNGNFMSPTINKINGKFYDSEGNLMEETEEAGQMADYAQTVLDMSDKIIYGDLLRFYTPDGFTAVDRSKYNYNIDHDALSNTDEKNTTETK